MFKFVLEAPARNSIYFCVRGLKSNGGSISSLYSHRKFKFFFSMGLRKVAVRKQIVFSYVLPFLANVVISFSTPECN